VRLKPEGRFGVRVGLRLAVRVDADEFMLEARLMCSCDVLV
jgi:ribosomal protein L37AE/L43A